MREATGKARKELGRYNQMTESRAAVSMALKKTKAGKSGRVAIKAGEEGRRETERETRKKRGRERKRKQTKRMEREGGKRVCMRNHAASLGCYATDGCGDFILDDTSPNGNPRCAACGCHYNFHREVMYPLPLRGVSYMGSQRGGGEELPRPMAANVMPPSGMRADVAEETTLETRGKQSKARLTTKDKVVRTAPGTGRLRFRTAFTAEQKERMLEFAKKLGWTLRRKDQEAEIERFCKEIGVSRQVFKVWIHNHKYCSSSASTSTSKASSATQLQDHQEQLKKLFEDIF